MEPSISHPDLLVRLDRAAFGYRGRVVVRADRFEATRGRCVGVFGPNGVGKTTLVRGVAGLLRPLSGDVVAGAGRGLLRVAYVPQHRSMESHWPVSGLDVAAMQVSARRRFGWCGRDSGAVRSAMDELGVGDLASRRFSTLSGGQQQRFILAGALAGSPDLLVLDEPTEGLDLRSRRMLFDVLIGRKRAGLAVLLVSHEIEDLTDLADDVAWVHPGDVEGEPGVVEWTDTARFGTKSGAAFCPAPA